MIRDVENYLAARHAAGFELKSACYLLRSFARFAAARREVHVRTTTAIDWASRTVSEALGLQFSDITPDWLLIRKTKFQKTRLAPLHPTAVAHIELYLQLRRRARSSGQHVFIDDDGRPLRYWKVYATFQKLLK